MAIRLRGEVLFIRVEVDPSGDSCSCVTWTAAVVVLGGLVLGGAPQFLLFQSLSRCVLKDLQLSGSNLPLQVDLLESLVGLPRLRPSLTAIAPLMVHKLRASHAFVVLANKELAVVVGGQVCVHCVNRGLLGTESDTQEGGLLAVLVVAGHQTLTSLGLLVRVEWLRPGKGPQGFNLGHIRYLLNLGDI